MSKPDNTEKFNKLKMHINTPMEEILENVKFNIKRPLPQLDNYPQQSPKVEIAIVAGGWSLEETLPELFDLYHERIPILALNGAGNFLVKNNIRPDMVMVLDARVENHVFVEEPIPGCKYLLASQCHPSLFDTCKDREVIIWHTHTFAEVEHSINYAHYGDRFKYVPGGSTVGLRSLSVAFMLGWRLMHLFGFDSCYHPDGRHHSYEQKWNDGEGSTTMWAELRGGDGTLHEYRCSAWQAHQAEQFFAFIQKNGDNFRLSIHGDGLLAAILSAGVPVNLRNSKEG